MLTRSLRFHLPALSLWLGLWIRSSPSAWGTPPVVGSCCRLLLSPQIPLAVRLPFVTYSTLPLSGLQFSLIPPPILRPIHFVSALPSRPYTTMLAGSLRFIFQLCPHDWEYRSGQVHHPEELLQFLAVVADLRSVQTCNVNVTPSHTSVDG